MDSIHDPHNIMGMASILVDDEDENKPFDMSELNDIEQSIIKGLDLTVKKQEKSVDHVSDYKHELDRLSKQFDLGNQFTQFDEQDEEEEEDAPKHNWSEHTNASEAPRQSPINSPQNYHLQQMQNDHSHAQNDSPVMDNEDFAPTHEEIRQKQIDRVLSKIDKSGEKDQYLQEEDAEDEMARIIEQVDLLRSNLEAEGVDLSRIQPINTNSNAKEAKAVLKILQIKNDRMRYCDMFEEAIIAGAYALESVFDGKNVWFGKQIDLTGWSETVKVKLRRMRYDTSQFVSDTVKGFTVGSGWRILLELLPSLFLYSRDRKLRSNDSIASDAKYKDALRDLNR